MNKAVRIIISDTDTRTDYGILSIEKDGVKEGVPVKDEELDSLIKLIMSKARIKRDR